MTLFLLILGAVIVLGALIYNRLVRDRNRVEGAWSDIDVQLQRRHDLVPQLVEAVSGYADYEKATLEAVTLLREEAVRASTVARRGEKEEALGAGVMRLLAVAEDYPDLKANENFLKLQQQLVETEDYLQFARRYYNGAVRVLNTRVESVPSNIVAKLFGFGQREFFQKEADEVANVPLVEFGQVE
ncbi:MAG: LemA family protein [Woeseiaceae bacterium]|nr:LemA family protein [Woeseiaceae bacterium]